MSIRQEMETVGSSADTQVIGQVRDKKVRIRVVGVDKACQVKATEEMSAEVAYGQSPLSARPRPTSLTCGTLLSFSGPPLPWLESKDLGPEDVLPALASSDSLPNIFVIVLRGYWPAVMGWGASHAVPQ